MSAKPHLLAKRPGSTDIPALGLALVLLLALALCLLQGFKTQHSTLRCSAVMGVCWVEKSIGGEWQVPPNDIARVRERC